MYGAVGVPPKLTFLYVIRSIRHCLPTSLWVCVQGTIVYSVVGVPPAPSFFAVDSLTGSVTVRGNLKTDLSMSYVVSVCFVLALVRFGINTSCLRKCLSGDNLQSWSLQTKSLTFEPITQPLKQSTSHQTTGEPRTQQSVNRIPQRANQSSNRPVQQTSDKPHTRASFTDPSNRQI